MWFIFTISTLLSWGIADLFYKKSAEKSKYSHLKTSMIVGILMGIHAVLMLIFTDMNYNFMNILIYLPVSLMYILSMTIGYFGLKYLELSISSPIQNSSGAVVCILCLLFLSKSLDVISIIGVSLICVGIFLLGVIENKDNHEKIDKYKKGFVAILIPIIYCIVDAMGTFFDAFYLDDIEKTPLIGVSESTIENVANTSYELTFLICSMFIFIYLKFIKNEKIKIKDQKNRISAGIFETLGQFTYVFALSGNSVIAAPIISAYSIISIILSRIFLKEKLSLKQYIIIFMVIVGIILLGINDL